MEGLTTGGMAVSWNNVIPMKVVECQMTCKKRDPSTGYVLHEPECRIGQEILERERQESETNPPASYPIGP